MFIAVLNITMLPSGSSKSSVVIILPLFNIIQLHLSSLNDISMSLLLILVMWISESMSHSLFAYSGEVCCGNRWLQSGDGTESRMPRAILVCYGDGQTVK